MFDLNPKATESCGIVPWRARTGENSTQYVLRTTLLNPLCCSSETLPWLVAGSRAATNCSRLLQDEHDFRLRAAACLRFCALYDRHRLVDHHLPFADRAIRVVGVPLREQIFRRAVMPRALSPQRGGLRGGSPFSRLHIHVVGTRRGCSLAQAVQFHMSIPSATVAPVEPTGLFVRRGGAGR
ncbi:uncharacterized protein BO97DRAFT_29435 [Aspergillus homomorphus CBS 101889]|uniref:Uncharacterized protein n=1 Tax=Aspergillus homomorphus (strain CBS 101889) TaxID=1450537 RepID=A0A395I2M8_ASPHC|nr:hypothetical protein BO97DRAFT_29435 [Aspergillus homomorphus CBS 101889]RAL13923.1 hypothetical protein BO97DRAFT_29435 [Aspergillus homomorphus CBS 101889]